MAEAQNLGINLDSKSIEVLKQVDAIHRDSLINIAIALVSKTGYFRTLTGKNDSDDLDDIASLEVEDEDGETTSKPKKSSKKSADAPAKPKTSWDSF